MSLNITLRNLDGTPTFREVKDPQHSNIVLNNLYLRCPGCDKFVPMTEVGMRNVQSAEETRNQPRCIACR